MEFSGHYVEHLYIFSRIKLGTGRTESNLERKKKQLIRKSASHLSHQLDWLEFSITSLQPYKGREGTP